MKPKILFFFAAALLLCAPAPVRADDRTSETPEQKTQRMEWFDDAKLGIFIHWGIYAVDGISESWAFYNNYLPHEEYMRQLGGFTASKYDPAAWAKLIRESGARYTVNVGGTRYRIDAFAHRFNHTRPHQALGDLTPAEYLSIISQEIAPSHMG